MTITPSLQELIEALGKAVAVAMHELQANRPRWYSARELPSGCPSARALRERCRKLGVPMTRAGRELLVDAAAYDDAVASRAKRPAPPKVTLSDQDALEQMGVVFPLPRKAS